MGHSEQPSGFSHFVAEMRRRHVMRFAVGYAAAVFVVLQLAEILFPAFGIGEAVLRALVIVTVLGFPPALVLAWVYDITTEGIKRTEDEGPAAAPSRLAVASLVGVTLAVTGGLGMWLAGKGAFEGLTRSDLVAYDASIPIRSLAVLPLEDFSPTGDQAYFASGTHEELIAKLSMLADLRVVSRTTVMQYAGASLTAPEIGTELGVDVLIEGSVARSGDRVRVTLQIIHAPSDSHIQTLQWDTAGVTDVLAFQTDIAHGVVHVIDDTHQEATFEAATAAIDVEPEAQDAYLRARHEYDRGTADGYRMAMEYFQRALEEDPDFAPALAGIASARFLAGLDAPEPVEAEMAQAHEEALAAYALDSTSMEAKEVLSFIERTMPELTKNVVVVPAPPDAPGLDVITSAGTFDVVSIDGLAIDSGWVEPMTDLGARIEEQTLRRLSRMEGAGVGEGTRQAIVARQALTAGRYAEAARLLQNVVETTPQASSAWQMLARSHAASGDAQGAAIVIEQWHDAGAPGAPDETWVMRLDSAVQGDPDHGYWSWTLDRLTTLESEGAPVPAVDVASAHAALGHTDEAFRYLFQAVERGEPGVYSLRSDPVWDGLRADPRFHDLSAQVRAMRLRVPRRPPRDGGRR